MIFVEKAPARQSRSRSAMTLIEVLVAIFVMGIGLIALLALFPIGVLRMAQAIQDGRTAHIAKNADSLATAKSVRNDPLLTSGFDAFQYPSGLAGKFSADPNGPSFPVLVDPVGYPLDQTLAGASWVARRSVSYVETPSPNPPLLKKEMAISRWFRFLDDIYFNSDGTVPTPPSTTFEREYRYSWAYMLQRSVTSDPKKVELKVVVFKNRPTLGETRYDTNPDTCQVVGGSNNLVKIRWTDVGTYPQIRPGDWILDVTRLPFGVLADKTSRSDFHRVVAISDIDSNNVQLEVQSPFPSSPVNLQLIVMEGVAEVFRRGFGRNP